jgi:hypothetical protein
MSGGAGKIGFGLVQDLEFGPDPTELQGPADMGPINPGTVT